MPADFLIPRKSGRPTLSLPTLVTLYWGSVALNFKEAILGVTWALTIISLAAVVTRFYLRRKFQIPISLDDWLIFVAEFLQCVYQAVITKACTTGLGRPLVALQASDIIETNKWGWISTPFSIAVSVIARISITILLIHMFGTRRWFTWSMIISIVIITLLGVTNVILIWAMCSPPEALWDTSIKGMRCLDFRVHEYLTLSLQVLLSLSDVLYVVLPVTFIYKRNLATRQKVGLAILLGLSLLTAAAAVSKVVINITFSNIDPTTNASRLFTLFGIMSLITSVEQALVITLGCVPALRSIEMPSLRVISDWVFTKHSSTTKGSSASRHKNTRQSGPYQDMELRPYDTSGERIVPLHSITKVQTAAGVYANGLGNHIHRTDDFTVTYNDEISIKGMSVF